MVIIERTCVCITIWINESCIITFHPTTIKRSLIHSPITKGKFTIIITWIKSTWIRICQYCSCIFYRLIKEYLFLILHINSI